MSERTQDAEARSAIMASIREHLAASAPFDAVRATESARHDATRRVRRDGEAHADQHAATAQEASAREVTLAPLERFKQSLEAVGGRCAVVRGEAEAAAALEEIINGTQARRVAVSDSPLVRRVVARVNSGAQFLEGVAAADLFDCDVGVTGAQWAVAETGTLVLESDAERHRLASLVPPVHVALVASACVRQTLAEVLEETAARGRDQLSRAITFVTGPSRTSDIELTLAIGVHGPGALHVIFVEGAGDA